MWMWMVCFLLNQIVEEKKIRAHSRSSFEMEKSWISVKKINHSTMIDSIISISTLLKFKSIYWRSKSFPHFSINRNWRYKFLPPFHLSEPFPSCLVPFGVRPNAANVGGVGHGGFRPLSACTMNNERPWTQWIFRVVWVKNGANLVICKF